jgi:hypothetical protein
MGTIKNLNFKSGIDSETHKNTETRDEDIMDEIKFRQLERLEKLKQERTDLSGGKGKKSNDHFS